MRINEIERLEEACNRLADMLNLYLPYDIGELIDKVEGYIEEKDNEIYELKDTVKDLEKQIEKLEGLLKDKDEEIEELKNIINDLEEEEQND